MADDTQYRITGRVLNQRTQQGERGLRVEAWDRDTRFHDLLGDATTAGDGSFTIAFTGAYFGDFAPDQFPDVFFKIFLGDTLLKSTFDQTMKNVRETDIRVTLFVDIPEERPAAPDRISANKTVLAVEFVRQSDFKGVGREASDRAKSFGGAVGGVVMTALKNFDFQPLKAPAVRNNDLVGQDALTAEKNLSSSGVTVNDRVAFNAGDVKQNAQIVRSLPSNLKSGDRVDLYVDQNQQVRGYVVVRPTPPTDINQSDVLRIEGEVGDLQAKVGDMAAVRDEVTTLKSSTEQEQAGLRNQITDLQGQLASLDAVRAELESVRKDSLDKDTTIASLRDQVGSLKTQQDQILQFASPQRLADIEGQLKRLQGQTPAVPVKEAPRAIRVRGATPVAPPPHDEPKGPTPARPKKPKPPTRPPSGGKKRKR